MEFSQWLQQEMDKRQLTNYRLAKLSGVHQTTIANLLDGKKPQIETERKIREAISRMDYEKEKSPSITGEGNTNQSIVGPEEIKAAFWGGDKELSKEDMDAMWNDVKRFADFVAQQKKQEKKNG